MKKLGYYAKDSRNNLFQYEWGADDEFYILNSDGDMVMDDPNKYEVFKIGIIERTDDNVHPVFTDIMKNVFTVFLMLVSGFVFSQYNSEDLLQMLAQYGDECEDYIPTWNNYLQDASCNTAQWQYLGDGSPTFIIGQDSMPTQNLRFQTYFQNGEVNCEGYEYFCNGSLLCTVRVEYDGCLYERSAVGYAQRNPSPFESCGSPFDVTPSGTFWAGQPLEFEPYEFLVQSFEYDLNDDGKVDSVDLLDLLVNYGQ